MQGMPSEAKRGCKLLADSSTGVHDDVFMLMFTDVEANIDSVMCHVQSSWAHGSSCCSCDIINHW